MREDFLTYYKDFLESWGFEAQAYMAIEEMSELIKELSKKHRKRNDYKEEDLVEEIADVLNMVEQLEYFVGEDKVEKVREEKIQRTVKRLAELKQKQNKGEKNG